jgi:hypothetical protein
LIDTVGDQFFESDCKTRVSWLASKAAMETPLALKNDFEELI